MTARKSPGFPLLALSAVVGVVALVGGLVALRRHQATQSSAEQSAKGVAAPTARPPLLDADRTGSRQDAGVRALRSMLPAQAWVVADVDLSLLGAAGWTSPSALKPLDCDHVPPPARLALAVVPAAVAPGAGGERWPGAGGPSNNGDGRSRALPSGVPDLVVAALGASSAFRDCAKRKLLAESGKQIAFPGGFEVIENAEHTRLVSHAERDLLLFATASAPSTAELIAIVQGERPSATTSAHHVLAEALGSRALGVTASLPPDWLERAGGGPEATQSPLSALEAGALGVRLDGSLDANFFCSPAREKGCPELATFLLRAKSDVLSLFPPDRRAALEQSFHMDSRPHALHVSWRLSPSDVALLLTPLLGG